MNSNFLDFEQPIVKLEKKIESLIKKKLCQKKKKIDCNLNMKIKKLQKKSLKLTKEIFSNLDSWKITQIARHPIRPHTLDYIERIFTNFQELAGDRVYADDKAIIGGLARLNERSVMVIGHQKGRNVQEQIYRNFGMSSPEGYRKSLRLMRIAEKFKLPIITFIDTPGAYPGIGAEERGQFEAIAHNLQEMSHFAIPIICTVIGEGGSGGALAIGVGDKINMLQYSIYSVISPEGCASILWKNSSKASLAAESMAITARHLESLKLINSVIKEPLGGAHRNYDEISYNLKKQILDDLNDLEKFSSEDLKKFRYERLMSYGRNINGSFSII